MKREQLAELRNFFTGYEPRLPLAVDAMYQQLLEAAPEVKPLFKGDFQQQEQRYLNMLRELVKFTRSSQLWPVQPGSGISTIPAIDRLGTTHSQIGITREHFDKMKAVLTEYFREDGQGLFTPAAEEALSFIFDVAARAAEDASGATAEELARKNKLPHSGEDDTRKKERAFWKWFENEEDLLFNFEKDQDRVFGRIGVALANVAPELTFEFGPDRDGVREFIISAGGIRAAFPTVESLADAAPKLPRWNFVKFRPRRNPIMELRYASKTVDPQTVQFSLLTNGRELGLYLYFDGYDEKEKAVWGQIGYLLLDEALGEYDVETKVGLIEFHPTAARHDVARFPLPRLPELFDEKYASLDQALTAAPAPQN